MMSNDSPKTEKKDAGHGAVLPEAFHSRDVPGRVRALDHSRPGTRILSLESPRGGSLDDTLRSDGQSAVPPGSAIQPSPADQPDAQGKKNLNRSRPGYYGITADNREAGTPSNRLV